MRILKVTTLALTLALLAWLVPGIAQGSSGSSIHVTYAGHGVIRGDLGRAPHAAPLRAARIVLKRFAHRLHVSAADFRFDSVRHSIVGTHIRGTEYRAGVPVAGTSAAVHIVRHHVWQVEARGSTASGLPVANPVGTRAAVAAALSRLHVTTPTVRPAVQRMLVPHRGRLVDAYRVSVFSLTRAVAAEVQVRAADGSVLAVRDNQQTADGTATVFDPNPIVSTKNNTLRQPGETTLPVDADLDSAELTAALKTIPIRDADQAALLHGQLVGPWVNVQGPAPLGLGPSFTFTRGDPRFETTMAYAHLDRLQRYIQSLGFTGSAAVNAEPQDVYTLPVEGFDNSFYVGGNDLILYGAGGVDDAEDAEVILHEYGHAIHDAQVPGWGETEEGGAMGEGWGDFLAGTYYAGSISGGFQDECIADWDATSYSSANPPCLRRLDGTKKYPKDMEGEVHADGEIWSAFLWRLRTLLGCPAIPGPADTDCAPGYSDSQVKSDRVLKLVLTSHEFLTTTADFGDAVAALRMAANALGRADWAPLVDLAATERGLPKN